MQIFKLLSMKVKLFILMLIMLCSMALTNSILLMQDANSFKDGEFNKSKSVVQAAYSRLEDLYQKMNDRGLSENYIRNLFYSEVGAMNYNGDHGYMFLYDTNGNVLRNSKNPNLEGQNRIAVKDSLGRAYIQQMVDTAKSKGDGVVEYVFKKPNAKELSNKASYFKYFKPLDIIVASGIYLDEIDAKKIANKKKNIELIAPIFAVVLLLFVLIMVDFNKSLKNLITSMKKIADNKTDVELDLSRKDEIGQIASCVEIFKENTIQRLALEENAAKEQARLEQESQMKIQEVTTDVAVSSTVVEEHISGISVASSELSSTLEDIGIKIDETSNMTMLAKEEAEKGNNTILNLNQNAVKIGEVVKLIQEIAEKTNLLALNASIEAARAGDEGRGFAVVAEEVKKLAAQTSNATNDISNQVKSIQSNSDESVKAIENIGKQIDSINEFTQMLVFAMSEQRKATNDISERMVQASDCAKEVSKKIQEIRK